MSSLNAKYDYHDYINTSMTCHDKLGTNHITIMTLKSSSRIMVQPHHGAPRRTRSKESQWNPMWHLPAFLLDDNFWSMGEFMGKPWENHGSMIFNGRNPIKWWFHKTNYGKIQHVLWVNPRFLSISMDLAPGTHSSNFYLLVQETTRWPYRTGRCRHPARRRGGEGNPWVDRPIPWPFTPWKKKSGISPKVCPKLQSFLFLGIWSGWWFEPLWQI